MRGFLHLNAPSPRSIRSNANHQLKRRCIVINETHPTPKEPKHLKCEVCQKEIPESSAQTIEAKEYIHHFCGLECLEKWRKTQENSG